MKVTLSMPEWHFMPERPTEDGDYAYINMAGEFKSCIGFTVKGGWNTHVDSHGLISLNNVLPDDYVIAWAKPIIATIEGEDNEGEYLGKF